MNLGTIQPVLKAQVAAWAGIPASWEDEPRNFGGPAVAYLSLPSIVGQGRDEVITTRDPLATPGQDMGDEYRGSRLLTLTVKVESFDQTAGKTAVAYLELVRIRAFQRTARDALAAVSVALVRAMAPVDLSTVVDGRRNSLAALDLILAARVSDVNPTRYPYLASVDFRWRP